METSKFWCFQIILGINNFNKQIHALVISFVLPFMVQNREDLTSLHQTYCYVIYSFLELTPVNAPRNFQTFPCLCLTIIAVTPGTTKSSLTFLRVGILSQ